MRKKVFGRKFARGRKGRTALFKSLLWSLFENGQIVTTKAKAKAIQPDVDKLITKAKENTEASRRLVHARLGNKTEVSNIVLREIVERVGGRTSGFTRIVPLPRRTGDQAEMVRLELVDKKIIKKTIDEPKTEKKKSVKKSGESQAASK
jgi:large subunit ribosomal protein L17